MRTCTARKGVRDSPILAQGLPAVRRAGLPASGWFTRRVFGGLARRVFGGLARRLYGGLENLTSFTTFTSSFRTNVPSHKSNGDLSRGIFTPLNLKS